jgi:hypothetical protein
MQDNKKKLEIFDFVPLTRYIQSILEVYAESILEMRKGKKENPPDGGR